MPQVIYITCTMAAWDFADIYTRSPRACGLCALGVYISKIPRSHGITITYSPGKSRDTLSDTLLCHDYGLVYRRGWASDAHASMTNHPDDSG